jgi:hypothetical protein
MLANVPTPDLETPFYKAWKRQQEEKQREWANRDSAPVQTAKQETPEEQALKNLMRLLQRRSQPQSKE